MYLWSLPIALAWPVMQNILFFMRFGHLPLNVFASSFVFLPMGFLSAIILIFLVERSGSRSHKASAALGYVLASPFALLASLFSGLLVMPLLGTLIYGTVPLMIGTFIGYVIGLVMNRPETA